MFLESRPRTVGWFFAIRREKDRTYPWTKLQIDAPQRGIDCTSTSIPLTNRARWSGSSNCGARRLPWRYQLDDDFIKLEDPDGNDFCVVQKSASEL
jgi:hypothetical protein